MTDHIIEAIDAALEDYSVGPDAMRCNGLTPPDVGDAVWTSASSRQLRPGHRVVLFVGGGPIAHFVVNEDGELEQQVVSGETLARLGGEVVDREFARTRMLQENRIAVPPELLLGPNPCSVHPVGLPLAQDDPMETP